MGLPEPEPCRIDIATRPRKWGGTDIIQLARFSAAFLALCDGNRTLADIASRLGSVETLAGVSAEQVCAVAFEELQNQRLLDWARASVPRPCSPRYSSSCPGHPRSSSVFCAALAAL